MSVRVAVASRSFSKHPVLREELLRRYPNATFNETGRTLQGDELVSFLSGHQKAIIGLEVLDPTTIARLPELKAIGKYGVGLDKLDLEAMAANGIAMGCEAGVNKRAVAELALTFMLELVRNLPVFEREMRAGEWRNRPSRQLTGRVVGIVGCGNVGKEVVRLLKPFKCKILVNDIRHCSDFYRENEISAVGLDELLAESEIVTLHVPLDSTTRNMMTEARLSQMRSTSYLINTARGGLVDENALAAALAAKRLAGAAFDVFDREPATGSSLLPLDNFISTPHVGGSSEEAILAMGRAAIASLESTRSPLDYR